MTEEVLIPSNPGYIPDPYDERDALAAAFMPELLSADPVPDFSIARLPHQVNLQGPKPSCVGQSLDRLGEYYDRKEGVQIVNRSPRDIYAWCKRLDGSPSLEGTFFRVGLDVVRDKGVVPNALHPDNWELPNSEYLKVYEDRNPAQPYRIKGYVRFENVEQALKFAFDNQVPVLLGVNGNNVAWGNEAVRRNGNVVPQWNPNLGGNWGHALILVGKKTINGKVHLEVENSWGNGWGDNGRAWVGIDYIGIQTGGIYGLYDLPNNWKDINNNYLMWQKEQVIRAFWQILELMGHPPINSNDIAIHMKAQTPDEFVVGLKSYVQAWKEKHANTSKVSPEEIARINILMDSIKASADEVKTKINS